LFKDKFKKGKWDEYIETYDKTVKGNIASSYPFCFPPSHISSPFSYTPLVEVKDTTPVNVDEMHHPEKYAIARFVLIIVRKIK